MRRFWQQQKGQTIFYSVTENKLLQFCEHIILHEKGVTIMTTVELTEIKAAYIADARGVACPGPLLEVKKAVGSVKVGEILEVWSGDANTKNDLPKWAAKVGH
ncbi:MAG: sulfurtransferase TusA family protein, partial [Anaerolineae bacterium]